MRQISSTSIAILLVLFSERALAALFDVRSYGGVGDGVTMNTRAFAAAIQAASEAYTKTGELSIVQATNGSYLSGQIVLATGVYLSVTSSATLLASSNVSDYPVNQTEWAFIWANGALHTGIVGDAGAGGTLDGQYQQYIGGWDSTRDEYIPQGWPNCTGECRPRLVKLYNCGDVSVTDVTLRGSPDWTLHLWNVTGAHVRYITQHGDERWPNNDGIDIDSSQNVLVEDSSFATADDGVCLKSTAGCMECMNVTVRNVTIRSRSGAIKFGSATPVSLHDMVFENIYIWDSNRGLAVQQRDAGDVYNIAFRNILINGTRLWPVGWWGAAEPLYLSSVPRDAGGTVGRTYNISFVNISAFSQGPAVLNGAAPGQTLQDITLSNVSIVIDRWQNWNYSDTSIPASPPCIDYEPSGAVPVQRVPLTGWMPGMYVAGVQGLLLDNVHISFNTSDAQSYWGTECINATAAGFPVVTRGGSCVPP